MPTYSWPDFLAACKLVAAGDHDFKTIVIDTADNAFKYCSEFVCGKHNIEYEGDLGHGKGWALVKNEWHRVLTRLASLPYGLVLISHAVEKTIETRTGEYTKTQPSLPDRARHVVLGLPRMNDASGALAGRFMILRLTNSFYGREDKALTAKLLTELPGILNWAIEGWRRLRDRGHFVQPSSVEDAVRDMEDLSSPVGAFVRDRCEIGPGMRAWVDDLYAAWKTWCEQEGRSIVTTKQTFGRDLSAAVPGVTRRRGTGNTTFYEGISLKGAL